MTTRFEDFTRQQAVAEENVLLRQRLAQLGTVAPPLPEGISPDEENFFLRRFAGEADPAIRAESQRRFLSILIEPFVAPAATGFAKFLAATGLGPAEFQQAVAEERVAPPPAVQPIGRAERRALERTRQDFPQIPTRAFGLPGEVISRTTPFQQVGLAEVGETFFDPIVLAAAARPAGRVAGALGRAAGRGAQRTAVGLTERALGPRGAVGAAPAPRIRPAVRPIPQAGGEVVARPPVPPAEVVPPVGFVPPEQNPLVQRATQAIRETRPLTQESAEALAAGRRRQIARAGAAARGAPTPLEVGPRFERALAGEIARPGFEPIRPLFNVEEMNELVGAYIWGPNSRLRRAGTPAGQLSFDQFNGWKAFQKLFHPEATVVPTASELGLLERAFGPEFVRAVMSKRGLGQRAWDTFLDVWNLPRALLATADLSATLRQGGVLAAANPAEARAAFTTQIKAFGSESFARAADDVIRTNANFTRFTTRPGGGERLFIADIGVAAPLSAREERFMTRLAGRLPIVRNSERAYVTYLNKLRFDVMDKMVSTLERAGVEATDAQLDAFANFVNWATGRGPLGPARAAAPILNGLFFSARLTTSRFALPAALLTRAPGVRMSMARAMVDYVGLGLMLLGIAEAGGAEVTADPRSSDLGKIRIGNTRLDIWSGFLQPVRFITQLLTGKRKSASTGTISEVGPDETIGRFFRSKLHPSLGLGIDVASEEDFLGEDFSLDPETFLEPDVRRNPLLRTLTPLIAQDIIEALQTGGAREAAIGGAAGLLGAGAVSFVSADQTSRETYEVPYQELWPFEKGYIRLLTRKASDREPSEFDKVDDQHYADFLALAQSEELTDGQKVDQYFSINTFYTGLKRGLSDAFFGDGDVQIVQGGTPEQQAALQEYYDALDSMKPSPESAVFFRERWSKLIPQLEAKWRREGTLEYVQANTNTRLIPQDLFDILPDSTKARIRASSEARARQEVRRGVPSPREQAEELRGEFAEPTPTPIPSVIQGRRGPQPTPVPIQPERQFANPFAAP